MDKKSNIHLISNNPSPSKPACTTCLHYHPSTNLYGFGEAIKRVTWSWRWPFRHVAAFRKPSAGAIFHARRSYYGGHDAADARNTCLGEEWEPNP